MTRNTNWCAQWRNSWDCCSGRPNRLTLTARPTAMITAPPVLQARNLAVAPDSTAKPILQGIHIELPRGASVALIGPSGSGKTTLLRTLSGHLRACGGQLVINGADLTVLTGKPLRRVRRQIGYVAQKHDL